MKIASIIMKSLREQQRQIWLVLLTVLMAPFFVGIYYLMWETSKLSLNVVIVNEDTGTPQLSYGDQFNAYARSHLPDSLPVRVTEASSRNEAMEMLINKEAEAILMIPEDFSEKIIARQEQNQVKVPFEISGDLSDQNYMLTAVYAHGLMAAYIYEATGSEEVYAFTETPVGLSASMEEFDLYIPGLLILSTIMLMFTAAIAFVRESEQNTILRLRLSRVRNYELIAGISSIQMVVGILSVILTLAVSSALGFSFEGSWGLLLLIVVLVCTSVIAFGLILAAVTKTANQILIIGNFPMFLFMFFTGAMMPVHGPVLFRFLNYDFTLPGIMSPYHGVQAVRKVAVYGAHFEDIIPELISLCGLIVLYLVVGGWLYKRKHLALQ